MRLQSSYLYPTVEPIKLLLVEFVLWKTLLLAVALLSQGPGYDTSTSILFSSKNGHVNNASLFTAFGLIEKLTRWDAVYFVEAAQRGYLFEQEWAFGKGFPWLVSGASSIFEHLGTSDVPKVESFSGSVIAHVLHLASVLVLFKLTRVVFSNSEGAKLAFLAASLHIITPGGLFLSAPYSESTFSFLNFTGNLFYVYGVQEKSEWRSCVKIIASGLFFGLATFVRGNGLLSGAIFLCDALILVAKTKDHGINLSMVSRGFALGLGGILIALGTIVPQWVGYHEYCSTDGRLWCTRKIPSIYTWVQSHYWNVGFLRYWTFSNLPLFLLAAPMLIILLASAAWSLQYTPVLISTSTGYDGVKIDMRKPERSSAKVGNEAKQLLWKFALPQIILASLALTSYHVQIITRIASGYAVWYWWIASCMILSKNITLRGRDYNISRWVIRWMVVYAIIQAGLFASFLPPA